MNRLVGIDFDNTIIAYDDLFHRLAWERDLIPPSLAVSKTQVRDFLRAAGRESAWVDLQGLVYGERMLEARPFEGALAFVQGCHECGVAVAIVSHKTRHPFSRSDIDLRRLAMQWLDRWGFLDETRTALAGDRIHFENSRADKLSRIGALRCGAFVDDLPELLGDAAFPSGVMPILFDPGQEHGRANGLVRVQNWTEALNRVRGLFEVSE